MKNNRNLSVILGKLVDVRVCISLWDRDDSTIRRWLEQSAYAEEDAANYGNE